MTIREARYVGHKDAADDFALRKHDDFVLFWVAAMLVEKAPSAENA
jgi:hypothetical protein